MLILFFINKIQNLYQFSKENNLKEWGLNHVVRYVFKSSIYQYQSAQLLAKAYTLVIIASVYLTTQILLNKREKKKPKILV